MINKILMSIYFKRRLYIIKKYFNGVIYADKGFEEKVYETWYNHFKKNIVVAITIVLSVISILIGLIK